MIDLSAFNGQFFNAVNPGIGHSQFPDYGIGEFGRDPGIAISSYQLFSECSGDVVEYRTRNREVTGSTHTRFTASNLEQVANLLCAQANSASYPQRDWK